MGRFHPVMSMPEQPQSNRPVSEIVERLDQVSRRDCVSLRDVIEAFGRSSFLPALMVPALMVVSPLSGIPLFSSVCGLTIALIAAQMVARRDSLWLPGFLMRRQVDGQNARSAVARMRRVAQWLDDRGRARFSALVNRPARKWLQVLCMLCGAAMPMLELVPFSSSMLGLATLFFAAGMLFRDGLLVLPGYAVLGILALVPIGLAGTF